jgi:hypothetical protein
MEKGEKKSIAQNGPLRTGRTGPGATSASRFRSKTIAVDMTDEEETFRLLSVLMSERHGNSVNSNDGAAVPLYATFQPFFLTRRSPTMSKLQQELKPVRCASEDG